MMASIIPTGTANLASVRSALVRVGFTTRMIDDERSVEDAEAVVLPGVGAFGPAMASLRDRGLVEPLVRRAANGRPVLAICLGLQLMTEGSDEAPGIPGLGIIPGRVASLPDTVCVPQLGWNRIEPDAGARLLQPGWMTFANGFALMTRPEGWVPAMARYGRSFVAAVERGPILACQFHPELSGRTGQALLTRWRDAVALTKEEVTC